MTFIPYTEWIIETNRPCITKGLLVYHIGENAWRKATGKLSWKYFKVYFVKQGIELFSFVTQDRIWIIWWKD